MGNAKLGKEEINSLEKTYGCKSKKKKQKQKQKLN